MTGLELLKAPETTASEIADIISAPCPPTIPAHCDGVSCRECWLTWLTGEPIKEKEPDQKRKTVAIRATFFLRMEEMLTSRPRNSAPLIITKMGTDHFPVVQ